MITDQAAAKSFWDTVFAAKALEGALREEAIKKLKALPKDLDRDLVVHIYRHMVEEMPYAVWPATKTVRDGHVEAFIEVLKAREEPDAKLLVAAHASGGLEGFRRAGTFLAVVHRTTNVPGTLKSLARNWEKLDPQALAKDAATALEGLLKEDPQLGTIIPFYALVYVVARASPSDPVLEEVRAAQAKWGDEYDTLGRTLAAAGKK